MVTDFYPPIVGGMEGHVGSLSRRLVLEGHQVVVLTSWRKGLNKTEFEGGVEVVRVEGLLQRMRFGYADPMRPFPPPVVDRLIVRKLQSLVRQHKPDLIHSHGWLLYSALSQKVPIIATLHDYGLICPKRTMLLTSRIICEQPFTSKCIGCAREDYSLAKSIATSMGIKRNRKKLGRIQKFIAVSSFVRDVHCRFLGLPQDKVVTIPNFTETPPDHGVGDFGQTLPNAFILFVGSLNTIKGINVLVDAHTRLNTNTTLVLMGTKNKSWTYPQRPNLRIVEDASDALVDHAYRHCKFVVVPSVFPDPCPTVALEAMSRRKPVIASDIGGLKDIVIHGETGLLVPPGDSNRLAEAISSLLRNEDECERLGRMAQERVRNHFSAEVVAPQIEEQYRLVLELGL